MPWRCFTDIIVSWKKIQSRNFANSPHMYHHHHHVPHMYRWKKWLEGSASWLRSHTNLHIFILYVYIFNILRLRVLSASTHLHSCWAIPVKVQVEEHLARWKAAPSSQCLSPSNLPWPCQNHLERRWVVGISDKSQEGMWSGDEQRT